MGKKISKEALKKLARKKAYDYELDATVAVRLCC